MDINAMTPTLASTPAGAAARTATRTPVFREKDAVCIEIQASPAPAVKNAGPKNGVEFQLSNLLIRVQLLRDRTPLPSPAPRSPDMTAAYRQLSISSAGYPSGLRV